MNTQRVGATATRQGKWWEINFSDLATRTAAPPPTAWKRSWASYSSAPSQSG